MSNATAQTFDAQGLPSNAAPQQSREEWLEARKLQLGATDVAAILGLSKFATAWEVYAEKTGKILPWKGNPATRAGQRFEPGVLDCAEAELGPLERNVRVVHPTLPMAATLDSRVIANGRPVEAKTTGIVGPVYGEWGDALTDSIPDDYLVQVHAQLTVTAAELAYLFALIAGRGVVQYVIERNEPLCQRLGNICNDWWHAHVLRDVPPEFTLPNLDVVKRLRKQPGKRIVLGDDALELCRQWEKAKLLKKESEHAVETLQAKVILALGDAEAADLPDGTEITYLETTRKGYPVKETTFRTLSHKRVKK